MAPGLLMRAAFSVFDGIKNLVFVRPMHTLYLHGPLFHGYGFWGGQAHEDICAALMPGTSALFWLAHADQCAAVIDKRLDAFVTASATFLYIYALYKLIHAACFYLFVLRPLLAAAPCLTRGPCLTNGVSLTTGPTLANPRQDARCSHLKEQPAQT
jgi:hypothetical protein